MTADHAFPKRINGAQQAHTSCLPGLGTPADQKVDRDDVEDGGAAVWAATIREIRRAAPGCAVEVLIPDFRKSEPGALETVLDAGPDLLNHNIETVPRHQS